MLAADYISPAPFQYKYDTMCPAVSFGLTPFTRGRNVVVGDNNVDDEGTDDNLSNSESSSCFFRWEEEATLLNELTDEP